MSNKTKNKTCAWLSFCDTKKPKGSQFLGVCIVEANDLISAINICWDKDINPGGGVTCWIVELKDEYKPFMNRLLSKEELIEFDLGVQL